MVVKYVSTNRLNNTFNNSYVYDKFIHIINNSYTYVSIFSTVIKPLLIILQMFWVSVYQSLSLFDWLFDNLHLKDYSCLPSSLTYMCIIIYML